MGQPVIARLGALLFLTFTCQNSYLSDGKNPERLAIPAIYIHRLTYYIRVPAFIITYIAYAQLSFVYPVSMGHAKGRCSE